jgi:hypothetical protein
MRGRLPIERALTWKLSRTGIVWGISGQMLPFLVVLRKRMENDLQNVELRSDKLFGSDWKNCFAGELLESQRLKITNLMAFLIVVTHTIAIVGYGTVRVFLKQMTR